MSDSRAIDQESRQRICQELHANILVEAGAGSGKTQMLAERMAAGVAAGIYVVEQMAAVTFTRKAASELRAASTSHSKESYQRTMLRSCDAGTMNRNGRGAFGRLYRVWSVSSPVPFTLSARVCYASGLLNPAYLRVSTSSTSSRIWNYASSLAGFHHECSRLR